MNLCRARCVHDAAGVLVCHAAAGENGKERLAQFGEVVGLCDKSAQGFDASFRSGGTS